MKCHQLILCLLLSACAGLPAVIEKAPAISLSYDQVNHDISSYIGVPVRWGGIVVDVENEEHFSLIQVIFYPLDYSGRPQLYKLGEGRFVVKSPDFLDPAVYTKDKEITVAGIVDGKIEQTVGKRIIQVPLLSVTAIHLWPNYPSYYDNRYYGPSPFFGYPGFYPFYRGGFYGPYYRW